MSQTKYKTVGLELTVALTAYTAGDVVGGLLEFDISDASGGGICSTLRMVDEDSQAEIYTLYVFNDKPTVIADGDAFATAVTVADLRKRIATIPIVAANYNTLNSMDYVDLDLTHADVLGRSLVFNGNGKLWAYLVATETPDYTNADTLWIGFDVMQG
jgi:hypothetical protein